MSLALDNELVVLMPVYIDWSSLALLLPGSERSPRLIIVGLGMVLTFVGLTAVFAIRLTTDLAIPGWATYLTGILPIILMQMLLVILVFVSVILSARHNVNARDYTHLTDNTVRICG